MAAGLPPQPESTVPRIANARSGARTRSLRERLPTNPSRSKAAKAEAASSDLRFCWCDVPSKPPALATWVPAGQAAWPVLSVRVDVAAVPLTVALAIVERHALAIAGVVADAVKATVPA